MLFFKKRRDFNEKSVSLQVKQTLFLFDLALATPGSFTLCGAIAHVASFPHGDTRTITMPLAE